jgi:hypothetical protein
LLSSLDFRTLRIVIESHQECAIWPDGVDINRLLDSDISARLRNADRQGPEETWKTREKPVSAHVCVRFLTSRRSSCLIGGFDRGAAVIIRKIHGRLPGRGTIFGGTTRSGARVNDHGALAARQWETLFPLGIGENNCTRKFPCTRSRQP